MFLRCSPSCMSKVPLVHAKGVEQGSWPRAKKGSFGDKEAGTSGDSGAGEGLLISPSTCPSTARWAEPAHTAWQNLFANQSHIARVGHAWRLVTCFGDFLLSVRSAAMPVINDHTIPPLVPSNTEKRSDQTLRVARKPGAAWCPKSQLSLPEIPSRARAPPSAPAQFLAHSPRPGTRDSPRSGRHLPRSRVGRGVDGARSGLGVGPEREVGGGAGCYGPAWRRGGLHRRPAPPERTGTAGSRRAGATTYHPGRATAAEAAAAAAPRGPARNASCPGPGPGAGGCAVGGGSERPGRERLGAARGGLAVAAAAGR